MPNNRLCRWRAMRLYDRTGKDRTAHIIDLLFGLSTPFDSSGQRDLCRGRRLTPGQESCYNSLRTHYAMHSAMSNSRAIGTGRMNKYTALTQNMFRHLARGEEVQYQTFRVKAADEKLIVRGMLQDGREVELHYRLRPGKEAGFSKEQFKNIFAFREKPIFSINIRSRQART